MQLTTPTPGRSKADATSLAEGGKQLRREGALKTFVVEDSPVIRQNLISTLEELAPVEVVGSADSESEAVERLGSSGSSGNSQCDLVILDIVLKQGTGLGVLGSLGGRGGAGPTFVVLSNYATGDVSRRALALGAARVFDKSNDIDALIEYCQQLAERKHRG